LKRRNRLGGVCAASFGERAGGKAGNGVSLVVSERKDPSSLRVDNTNTLVASPHFVVKATSIEL